jgi:hypothetical protein
MSILSQVAKRQQVVSAGRYAIMLASILGRK